MNEEEINKAWDRFDEAFYASASREELIENLRQIAGYNRYLLRISGSILQEKLDREAALQSHLTASEAQLCRAKETLDDSNSLLYMLRHEVINEDGMVDEQIKQNKSTLSSTGPCPHEAKVARLAKVAEGLNEIINWAKLCGKYGHPGVDHLDWEDELERKLAALAASRKEGG